jgi:hypothetical protein
MEAKTSAKVILSNYDGDAKTDLAVWRPSEGTWYIQQSTNNQTVTHQLGSDTAKDILVPADYDGDNKADVAVWQQSNGVWTIKQSSDNQIAVKQNNFTKIGQSWMIFRQGFIKFVNVKGENFLDQESFSFV